MKKETSIRLMLLVAATILFGIIYALASKEVAEQETSAEAVEAETCVDEATASNATRSYSDDAVLKPIIYLYNYDTSKARVELSNPERITCSYPKYTDGWEVYADGDKLVDPEGRELYSLYYESDHEDDVYENFNKGAGFLVKGENAADFLEEKLSLMGLNYREREEFIIYWLPKLEANEYNHIYFSSPDEIDLIQELTVVPEPTQFIRVNMIFEPVDAGYKVIEQEINKFERNYAERTVVEWGGIEVK